MNSYFTKTPNWIRYLYSNQVWSLPNTHKEIYLTFDDGPTPEITDWVLNTLEKYKAKATFFCIGKNIDKHPKIFKKVIKSGHAVGNHTNNHENGWKTNSKAYLNSVLKTEKIINTLNPKPNNPKLFRPPYGKIKKSQTKALIEHNYKVIMWSVLSWDFDNAVDAELCFNNVINNTKSGDVIVFHDSVKAFKKLNVVLPKILEYYSKKGFKFKAINYN